ncbi:FAD-dependent oxidoreductase [Desemzia sp. RIT804]|uniref:FAD-dependent oxidoreductase n=1 Tax=Desemzia sp. RIT 804 TaxID=2810209 RepID=UPI001952139D|nr:FAD-dependent oxidoreductase [Desemzia sp. RIT 804]MBM6615472.1 FAD-dependent oxidoreductase [Desemzia sp. RIT 804]
MPFSGKTRQENIETLKQKQLDLLIIGGGITGAGITLEAGAKGISNGLIEMQDFAAGTSSRSTKLIHGGLRYLKQFEVELVADVSQEREIIYNNASHIVQPAPMTLPIYEEPGASFDSFSAKVALKLYDELSDVQEEYKHYFLDREDTLNREPALNKEGLLESGVYLDYTSDDARLTLELLKKSHEYGSIIANYVRAVAFIYDTENQICGVKAEDKLTGEVFEIQATVVINATGPWSDTIRKMSLPETESLMRPTKGVHLVVDKKRLPVNGPIYTDTGLQDNRMIFVVPRRSKTYFGTTDTDYQGDISDPQVTNEDVEYLLKAVNQRFPEVHLTKEDIEASWAGLRPLISAGKGKDPSAVSRGSSLKEANDGLLTIAGGKLTDYRRMAEGSIKLIEKRLKEKTSKEFPEVETKTIKLSGGDVPLGDDFGEYVEELSARGVELGLSKLEATRLVEWYGSNAEMIFNETEPFTELHGLNHGEGLSLKYSLENEMTLTPTDYFSRRTDTLLFDHSHLQEIKEPIIKIMAEFYHWDEATKRKMSDELENMIHEVDRS